MEVLEGGDVFYRERLPGPAGPRGWLFGATLSAAAMIGSASMAWRGGWLAIPAGVIAVVAAMLFLTAVNFRALKIVVDRRGIAWRFGVLSRRYTLSEIYMFRESVYGFTRAGGGWGIGPAKDGVDVYEVWGANGSGLDIVVRRGEKIRHFLVSSQAPERLVAALVRANQANLAGNESP